MKTENIKFKLDAFVYVLFIVAVIGLGYSIHTKDFMTMIPMGFGLFVFGMCILIARLMNKRIREIENESDK